MNKRRQQPAFLSSNMIVIGLIFAATVGLYAVNWYYGLTNGFFELSGGVAEVGAMRVLAGDVPHRDFWTMYAPGQFYVLALLFRVFGTHLLVERIAASVVLAAAAAICYGFVFNATGRRWGAVAVSAIFVMAVFNTGYYRELGSYPLGIFFAFLALAFVTLYYKTINLLYLFAAGLSTGAVVLFKHDVGGYTAIAVTAGLVVYHLFESWRRKKMWRLIIFHITVYAAGFAVMVIPFLIYFVRLAGPDMLQNLVIFPLTDFPYARPEGYPSLWPVWIYDESRIELAKNGLKYIKFLVPSVFFLLGLAATGLAMMRRHARYAALGVTFSVGFLLHFQAAHVQINTHIITMSVYSLALATIFYDLLAPDLTISRLSVVRVLAAGAVAGWILAMAVYPVHTLLKMRQEQTATLTMPTMSGFKVTPEEAEAYTRLSSYVDSHLQPGQKLFVGLHRHDVLIVGDKMIYFLLNRPVATRYEELHPAITDTEAIQQEMIADLKSEDVPLILRKHIFTDETLEDVKVSFRQNLPNIGATNLDEFIQANYVQVDRIGPYEVWQKSADNEGDAISHYNPNQ